MWYPPNVASIKATILSVTELALITDDLPEDTTVDELLADALAGVVEAIRSAVSKPGRELGIEGTIPSEAKRHVLPLVRATLFERLTGDAAKNLQTDARVRAIVSAEAWLKSISESLGGIVAPEVAAPAGGQPKSPGASIIVNRTRSATRETMKGL